MHTTAATKRSAEDVETAASCWLGDIACLTTASGDKSGVTQVTGTSTGIAGRVGGHLWRLEHRSGVVPFTFLLAWKRVRGVAARLAAILDAIFLNFFHVKRWSREIARVVRSPFGHFFLHES